MMLRRRHLPAVHDHVRRAGFRRIVLDHPGQVVAAYVTRPRQIPVTLSIHQFGCIEDHLDVAGNAEA